MIRTGAESHRLARAALRVIPALLLLAVSFRLALPDGAGPEEAWKALSGAVVAPGVESIAWIALAASIFGVSLGVAAMRYRLLLDAAALPLPFTSVLRAVLVSTFFNTVLPGGVIGDAWRIYDVHDDTGRGPAALGVVTVERILGLQALGFVTLLGAPFVPFGTVGGGMGAALVGVGAACAFGPLILLHPGVSGWTRRAVAALPDGALRVRRALDGALDAGRQMSERPGLILRCALLSVLCQLLPVIAVFALSKPLGGDVAAVWFFMVVPFVTLMSMLPISVGGTGVREVLYVTLFGAVGLAGPVALALSLLTWAISLGWAAVGFALFVLGRGGSSGRSIR